MICKCRYSFKLKFLSRKLEFYTGVRSSHQRCSIKISVLKNFAKFKGKHLCRSLFFNKVADGGLQLYKKGDSDTGVLVRIWGNFYKQLF